MRLFKHPARGKATSAAGRRAFSAGKMRILPLIAATYFMVSGGPYAIEDIFGGAGLGAAILILLVLPFVWSLPTTLMIGELASAIPAEGGFYVWVRRALGPFWGYQEGWLSMTASIFDMALYPSIFVFYLSKLTIFSAYSQQLSTGWVHYGLMLLVVVLCLLWNLRGAPSVGRGALALFFLLLAPFGVFLALGLWRGLMLHPVIQWSQPHTQAGLSTAILVAMWNYMGWDNASTVAGEVENPQRNYPRAMLLSALLVALTYILPLLAMAVAGFSTEGFATGDWVLVAEKLGGPLLAILIVLGGSITGIGMFNALVLSYTRLPMAMAEDGMLPAVVAKKNKRGVPWVSVLLCGLAWAIALNLSFERLISIDLILYGSSLILEFVALIVLRLREPALKRPFKAGSFATACALGVGPTALILYALYVSRGDHIETGIPGLGSISALGLAAVVALLGPLFYWFMAAPMARRRLAAAEATD
jgi:amino acid transporter